MQGVLKKTIVHRQVNLPPIPNNLNNIEMVNYLQALTHIVGQVQTLLGSSLQDKSNADFVGRISNELQAIKVQLDKKLTMTEAELTAKINKIVDEKLAAQTPPPTP